MARSEWIERRLVDWAQWVTTGGGESGFPAMCVLHPEWAPPAPGTTPTLKATSIDSDVRATHRAIASLSLRLSNTVVVHYCMRLSLTEQAARLECAEATVLSRLDTVHAKLRAWFAQE